MKFNQLVEGQQFKYQGKIYTRSGPLMATDAQGQSKLMPRSAVVTPLSDSSPEPAPEPTKTITVAQARESFESFYTHCVDCLHELENDLAADKLAAMKQALESARQDYLINLQA